MSDLERATQSVHSLIQNLAQQQGARARAPSDRVESNTLVGKHLAPEDLTNKAGSKHWGRGCKLMAGANDERVKTLRTWPESHEANAPAVNPDASRSVGAQNLSQHHGSLLMNTQAGMEAQATRQTRMASSRGDE